MKHTFAELFKKYRLRAEFEKLSELGNALAEKGLYYEDSIFSHWQKGTRIPHERKVLLTLLEIFIEKRAVNSIDQINEFLESAGQGFLTQAEIEKLPSYINRDTLFQVPNPPTEFVGRESTIQEISKFVKTNIIHLYGQAGIGKTSVAMKAAHELRSDFPDGILWYRMDTCTIKDILFSLGNLLHIQLPHTKSTEVIAATIRAELSQKKILLILDNIEPKHLIYLLLPITSSSLILISQNKNISIPAKTINIPLKSFSEKETLSLYKNILGIDYMQNNKKILLDLSAFAGNLPLALSIFAKQIEKKQSTPEYLIHMFNKKTINLPEFTYENKNLSKTIEISYNNLSSQEKSVFLSLGIFEGRDFSIDAIAKINELSEEKMRKIIAELVNNSLIEESYNNKFRIHPMIKKFIDEKLYNPYIFFLLKLVAILFFGFTIFWLILQVRTNLYLDTIFSSSYFIVSLGGGIIGLYIAQKWGGIKSTIGKAILFFSLGLFAQTFGQISYTIYDIFYHVYIPYPSMGDIGYVMTIPFYTFGIVLLLKASGISFKEILHKQQYLLVFFLLTALFTGYFFILQHYIFDWRHPIKIFLDFIYPIGDAVYFFLSLATYNALRIKKYKNVKNKILFFVFALGLTFISDFLFIYQANNQSWQQGNLNDYMYFMSYILMIIAILQLNSYRKYLFK